MGDRGEEEEEAGLSRSGVNKLIKDSLPSVRVSNEARELVYGACLEFIRAVSTEATRVCLEEEKKTMSHGHVIRAAEALGLGPSYAVAAESVLGECREQKERRLKRHNSRLDKCGIPEEELLRQQQDLIRQARLSVDDQEAQALPQQPLPPPVSLPRASNDDDEYD